MGDGRPVHLYYWPNYSNNPYQRLFYGSPEQKFTTQPGEATHALVRAKSNPGELVCFHIHWLNLLLKKTQNPGGKLVVDEFLNTCAQIRKHGGSIAWTIHNQQEHESPDPAYELAVRKRLASIADVIVVHCTEAKRIAVEIFGAEPARVLLVSHGSYIGVYDDIITRAEARMRCSAPECRTLFANVGFLRQYKGLHQLISVTQNFHRQGNSAGLLIAGSTIGGDAMQLDKIIGDSPNIRLNVGRVADNEIQNYYNAANFVVLPYTSILTSGSAILAFSFGLPVIAPAIGALVDLVEDGVNGFLYDPHASAGLELAMLRAIETDDACRADMSEAAFARATTLRWSPGRRDFIHKIAAAMTRHDTSTVYP